MSRFTHVVKRSGAIVPFNIGRISNAIYRAAVAVGGRDQKRAEWLSRQVVEYMEATLPPDRAPHIEEIQDAVEKILIENGHAAVAKAYILYRDERNRRRRAEADRAARPSSNIPWFKIWRGLDWAVAHGLHTVDSMNDRIAAGEFPQIVHESEAAYEDDLSTATEFIANRADLLRLVIICGPSSSGKTTSTIKIKQRLQQVGLRFAILNVDNYFFDLEAHPKDEFGDYDFETPQALDLPLISEHIKQLIEGQEILIPYYDFKQGKRYPKRTPMRLATDEILVIDSLHGLYPSMTADIPDEIKFRLYLEPLLQMRGPEGYIRWTDLRMIRRMLRDAEHRAYDPRQTLQHWHYVRSSEMRNIIPYIGTTDFIVNSAMPYELALYRARLMDSFVEWEEDYQDDPLREDAYQRAKRIRKVLESVRSVEDDSAVPGDSVLREFIGASSLTY
ncbi:MAG TPA: ATP cone domain-containing protein [Anaerolineae bacterium]|jgi:uridine kinase|nr:ATP cone domain-containing protein [Anaerolineae bacterium]